MLMGLDNFGATGGIGVSSDDSRVLNPTHIVDNLRIPGANTGVTFDSGVVNATPSIQNFGIPGSNVLNSTHSLVNPGNSLQTLANEPTPGPRRLSGNSVNEDEEFRNRIWNGHSDPINGGFIRPSSSQVDVESRVHVVEHSQSGRQNLSPISRPRAEINRGEPGTYRHFDMNSSDSIRLVDGKYPPTRNHSVPTNVPETSRHFGRYSEPIRQQGYPSQIAGNSGGHGGSVNQRPESNSRGFRRKLIPMCNWGLKFRGDGMGLSFNDFISQVEMKACGQNMDPNEILFEFYDLLDGPAQTWYRAFFRRFQNWGALKDGMRRQFLPPDYNFRLRRQIEDRMQGPNENFGMFRANMEMLFADLFTPMSDRDKLDILIRNMDEFYLDKVSDRAIRTVDELEDFCKHLELTKNIILSRKSKVAIQVEPAFTVNPNSQNRRFGQFGRVSEIYETDELNHDRSHEVEMVNNRQGRPQKCWNCHTPGHSFNDCRSPRTRMFCFRCGKDNVTTKTCVCSENIGSRPAQ